MNEVFLSGVNYFVCVTHRKHRKKLATIFLSKIQNFYGFMGYGLWVMGYGLWAVRRDRIAKKKSEGQREFVLLVKHGFYFYFYFSLFLIQRVLSVLWFLVWDCTKKIW